MVDCSGKCMSIILNIRNSCIVITFIYCTVYDYVSGLSSNRHCGRWLRVLCILPSADFSPQDSPPTVFDSISTVE